MKKLLIIIPAYNEEANIVKVIEELQQYIDCADILVINDCSTDRTKYLLQEIGVNHLNTPFNLGYAGVIQTGFKYAKYKGYQYVAQFDGDGQHVASELKKMYDLIQEKELDIVIGSRFMGVGEYHHPFFRKLGTNIFRGIIRLVSGKEITDPTSGLQVLNKRVYERYAEMFQYPDYPDANLLVEMLLQGYRIEEVGVHMRERIAGVSMHAGIYKPIKYMIKMFYSLGISIIKNNVRNEQGEIRNDF